ncbi:unnamed protein product [Moneuplotes crassus]|uniref:Uncharacterized protein n=1 Tax=Euplotes crassus TaxID=5936 RepID=A0AAD1U5K9_EUPCR|nr:unnamed protein product [Moneuplotes crassus]
MKKSSSSKDQTLRAKNKRKAAYSVAPSGRHFHEYAVKTGQGFNSRRNLAKIYCSSQRSHNHTETRGKMRGKIQNISENKALVPQNSPNQLPNLVSQVPVNGKKKLKSDHRSHNVSKRRVKVGSQAMSPEKSDRILGNNIIFSIDENLERAYQKKHPSVFSSNVMSKRNKTSERRRVNNKLIYKRPLKKRDPSQRKNIDINDRFLFYKKQLNVNQPQLEQFKHGDMNEKNEILGNMQAQESQKGNITSPLPKSVILQKSKIAYLSANTQFVGKMMGDSPYNQTLTRPKYKRAIQERKHRKVVSYMASPYNTKPSKIRNFNKKANKVPRSTNTSWSRKLFKNEKERHPKVPSTQAMFNLQKDASGRVKKKSLRPLQNSPVPDSSKLEEYSPLSQRSPHIHKMETSIVRIQDMLKHMDDILVAKNQRKHLEIKKIAQEADSGRVGSSFQLPQNSGRESDLVTLLNIDDITSSNLA